MNTITTQLYLVSFFVTILLGILSFLNWRKMKAQEFIHLTEFWASLTLMTAISFIVRSKSEHIVALGLVGWIWPMKTITQLLQDVSGKTLHSKSLIVIPIIGGFVSLALASYHFSFTVLTLPFSLSVGIVGILLLARIFSGEIKNHYSFLANVTITFIAFFFFVRLLFPFWRMNNELVILGLSTHLLIIVGLASSTLSYYIEVLNKRHENQLQALLKERNDQLLGQSKYSELGMMSAGIAHEINNPLAIIQAKTTQLLRFYRDPARQKEMAEGLEQILYTSERINRTIQGVREFVHQDENLRTEDIPLKTLIDDVMAFCGQRMKNHGINLRFYGLDHFSIRGHKIQLEQVLLNLFNNSFDAIEFLPDKWIEISVHETPGTIQMFLKDSGSGIPTEVAKRIMEPFFTTKDVKKGTGLGLALARGIVEKHGGTLTYLTQEKHTTFLVELPKTVIDYIPIKEVQRPVIH